MHAPSALQFRPAAERLLPQWAQYAFLGAVIASSGNPIFGILGSQTPWLILTAVSVWASLYVQEKLSSAIYLVVVPFALLSALHVAFFGTSVATASIGFVLKLFIAAVCATTVQNFGIKFVRIMAVLAGLSLLFFLPMLVGVDVVNLTAPFALSVGELNLATIGVHTFNFTEGGLRNSGMFWEPGAFSGYLALALLFYATSKARWQVPVAAIVLIITALLTTRSTTGYAALAAISLFLVAGLNSRSRSPLGPAIAVIGSCFLLFAFVALSTNLEFLAAKTIAQWENALSGVSGNETTRFGNLFFDFRDLMLRPITGWSASSEPRFGGSAAIAAIIQVQGNGLSGFAVRYGLLGTAVALLAIFFGMRRWCSSVVTALICVVIVSIILFGQQFFNYPAFLCLFFLKPPWIAPPKQGVRQESGHAISDLRTIGHAAASPGQWP